MEEKGIKVNLINWPPVVYVRRGQHEEEVLREAMQVSEAGVTENTHCCGLMCTELLLPQEC
jgi:hypothetical protein